MWNKSARLLMVRVNVQKRRGFAFPVPVWVVDEFLEALADLARVGEMVIRRIPVPRDEKTRKHLNWVQTISPSGIIASTHSIIKELYRYKGLEVADVEVGEVKVKICLK
ncbi:MAG TPA: hypothetical protein VIM51_10265 [Desulfosporosinus sp.]